MKIKDIFESSTTAGAIATGAPARIGKTQKRAGSLFKGKVTNKPFYEAEVNEEEIVEQDLILVPDQIIKKDKGFIPHEKDRRDHEVEMARSELFAAAKDAQRIYAMLKNRSEDEGLMGWQQSYITLASDYLNSVADSLEHQAHTNEMTGGVLAGGMSNFEEGVAEGAPELLKQEMPLVRHIEKELEQYGYEKGTPEYNEMFKHSIAMYRKFGNIDAIKKAMYEEQAPMFTPEEKIANMNDKKSDGWRLYKAQPAGEQKLDEKCWDTHKQVGMKKKGGKMVPNCIPKESSIMKGIQNESPKRK